ncbi:uncharacterized protein LOC131022906 [Salvia miltiorrhiza]|uniref:uncharacterized protein LOC131022906 n=1 Tax=Salvia miltiorrhiza TaxID=226208 RepID=UPI0025ACF054|nr:uncharacterized protein LOC131022906 [Salvia miltiorrhiza]
MTGLKFGGSIILPQGSFFHQKVFGGQRYLRLVNIEKTFIKECKETCGRSETSLKLAYLYIVYGLLVMKDRTQKNVDLGYIHLMDDLERFLRYPWGRTAYDFLVPRTYNARKLLDKMGTTENRLTVEAYGFVYALQAWAYEIMPSLAAFCGKRLMEHENNIPRMQHWSADSGFHFDDLWPYFLPRSGRDPVPIIVSPTEYKLMDVLGIPSTLHPASPIPVFNAKSLVRKRRLTFEEDEAVGKEAAIQNTPMKNSEHLSLDSLGNVAVGKGYGEKPLISLDPRRFPRLVGKTKNIEAKKAKVEDDNAENRASSPALSNNSVEILNYTTVAEKAKTNSNALIFLMMELMEKVDKLDQKIDKLFVKVESGTTTLHDEVLECLRSYFHPKASANPIKSGGEQCSKLDEGLFGKINGEFPCDGGEFARFANIKELINMCKKHEREEGFSNDLCGNELMHEDPLARSKSEGYEEKSFFPRTSTGVGIALKSKDITTENSHAYTTNFIPSLNVGCTSANMEVGSDQMLMERLKYDPCDYDFNYSELNPFLRWQKAASLGDRYDFFFLQLPIH